MAVNPAALLPRPHAPKREITDADIALIRALRSLGHSQQAVAAYIGMAQASVSRVERGVHRRPARPVERHRL